MVLDGLRGTAALSVRMFHIWEMLVPDLAHNPMRHTFLAVDFFFLMSGFVLGHAYDARLAAPRGLREALDLPGFFKRRLMRLHPMVVISMVIGITLYLLDPYADEAQRIGEHLSLGRLVLCVGLSMLLLPTPPLPNTLGETHPVNGPSWTLFQEYIANMLYGLLGHRMGLRLHRALCVISALLLLWTAEHFGDLGHGWGWGDFWAAPVRLACPFLSGLLIYRLRLSLRLPQPFLVLSALLVGIFIAPPMGRFNGLFEAACVIVVFPLILAAGVGVAQLDGRPGRLCRLMGEISYPVYIVHYPFIYLFAHWNWRTHPAPLQLGAAVAGLFFGVVALAYALLRWYDQPVRAMLARNYLAASRLPRAEPAPGALES
jgi:peptidoglycan/LPS O-acetylase OafA/YrhL